MNNNIYIIQDGETINKTIVEIFKNIVFITLFKIYRLKVSYIN